MSTANEDCAGTAHAVAAFVAGELAPGELARLRAHRAACPECDTTWRDSLASAARMQKPRRRERGEDERRARRATNRRLALAAPGAPAGAAAAGRAGARRRAHLRLVALPALALVLMLVIHPMGRARRARLEVLAGEVVLTSNTYAVVDPAVPLVRGDQCSTGPGGRARIECASAVVELEEHTLLVVEDEMQGRFRLDAGVLRVEGECTVTSRFGVVEVRSGRVGLRVGSRGLELESRDGRAVATNSLGARRLVPGTRAVLGHPR